MRIGFITFEQFHGRQNIGSTRIRVKNLCKYWEEAEISNMAGKYDVIVYQKVYWIEHAEKFKGIKILDLCDPDWLHWGNRVKQMIDLCDAVTTSTLELAKAVVQFTDKPVWYIPDRLDPVMFEGRKKKHKGRAKSVAWYGYSENFPVLNPAIPGLIKQGIEQLIVIASRRSPYKVPKQYEGKIEVVNYPWTEETANGDIMKADIVINPRSNKARWKFKSNNKTINAWALGMPVAHNEDELKYLLNPDNRQKEADSRMAILKEKYNILDSVKEYKNLIAELVEKRQNEKEVIVDNKIINVER